ncbi:MAG: phosphate ABC transporter permease PstA [Halorhodospira sp.]
MTASTPQAERRLRRRYRQERRFKALCLGAIALSVLFILLFFADIIQRGYQAFYQAEIRAEVTYDTGGVPVERELSPLLSRGWLRMMFRHVEENPELEGKTVTRWVTADSKVGQYLKGKHSGLSEAEEDLVDELEEAGRARLAFNKNFFTRGDSKMPEMAGIQSAVVGSLFTLAVTMAIAFPIGVMSAIYLEEFAPDNRFTRFIEVNINNLAAVPSILYGLLGLAIFINFLGVPRSSALAGGLTLALMTLPIIIISTRAALRAVPDSVREAAIGVGASRLQMVLHHVLPLSLPGILTGSIIGMAQAMGETAPLLLVGMMAFIPSAPDGITDSATVLPAQIFTWASMPQRAFDEITAAGILVLLAVLLTLNATAVLLRRRFERRW